VIWGARKRVRTRHSQFVAVLGSPAMAEFAWWPACAPGDSALSTFTTLQNLPHRVRTIYGDSKSVYGGTLWAVPYSGVGQGNGAGPNI
jgi:hypothetical protein